MDRESPNPGNISSGSGGTALIPGFKTHRRWLAGIMRLVRKVKRRGVPVSQPGRTGGRGGICKLLRKRLQQGKGNAPLAPVQEEEEVVDVVLEDVPPVGVTEIRLDPVPPGPPQVLDDAPIHLDEARLAATADPQARSLLFSRLPAEVRVLIYHWVINNGTFSSFSLSEDDGKVGIHIFPSTYGSFSGRQNSGGSGGGSPTRRSANGGSQLGHSICVARVTADEFDPTRTVDEDGGVGEGASPSASSSQQSIAGGAGTGWRWTKPKCCRHSRCEALARSRQMLGQRGVLDNEEGSAGGLLALMMSCKRLYFEALPFLYSHPTFVFSDFSHLFAFRRALPSYHLVRIRHIEVAVHDHDCVFESVSYNGAAAGGGVQHLEQPPTPDPDGAQGDDDQHVGGAAGAPAALDAPQPSSLALPPSPPPEGLDMFQPPQQPQQQPQPPTPPTPDDVDPSTDALLRAARRAVLSRHWDALAEFGNCGGSGRSTGNTVLGTGLVGTPATPATHRVPAKPESGLASFRVSLFPTTVMQYGRGDERVALEPLAALPFKFRPPVHTHPGGAGPGDGGFGGLGGLGLLGAFSLNGNAGPVLEVNHEQEKRCGTQVIVDLPALHEYDATGSRDVVTATINGDGRAWGVKKLFPFVVRRREGSPAADAGA